MPTVINAKTSHVKPTWQGDIYEGDDPKPGNYPSKIVKMGVSRSSSDNLMFVVLTTINAPEGTAKAQYNGFLGYTYVVIGSDKDNLVEKEQALYNAICGKEDVTVKTKGDFSKFVKGDKQQTPVASISGVNPVGKDVIVRYKTEQYENVATVKADQIFAKRGNGPVTDEEVDAAADAEVEEDEDAVEAVEDYTAEDLAGKSLAELREILKEEFEMSEADIKAFGKAGAKLRAAILEAQEALAAEEEDEEDEDLDDEEDEDEEDDEEEEDDEDPDAELRAELAELDRTALKARVKKVDADFRTLKTTTDDAIREHIIKKTLPF